MIPALDCLSEVCLALLIVMAVVLALWLVVLALQGVGAWWSKRRAKRTVDRKLALEDLGVPWSEGIYRTDGAHGTSGKCSHLNPDGSTAVVDRGFIYEELFCTRCQKYVREGDL